MDALLRDLRYALRALRRSPGSTVLVILTLALGIGASTAIFSAVNRVLLRPLPYDDPSRLVFVGTTQGSRYPSYTSIPDFIDWKQRLTTLQGLAAAQVAGFAIVGEGTAERVSAARISPDFLSTLGVAPQLGRAFSAEEYRTGAEPVVLLSHSIWQRRWGGDPNVIGTTFSAEESRAGRGAFRVVGVTPADFQAPQVVLPGGAEIYMALPVDERAYARSRTSRSLRVIGRLKAGVSLEAAQREAGALAVAMAAQHVDANTSREGTLGIGVASLLGMTVGSAGDELLILLGASALLLLIGCANVANLLLARATGRAKEIAVRSALGARRGRVLRQLLTESTCLGVAGGIGGIVIAFAAVKAFRVVGPGDFPRLGEVCVDLPALAFALGLALITGMLFGLAPGHVSSRCEVSQTLREGTGRSSAAEGRTRLRSALVSAETALALVVLAGAGLLINSYLRLQSVELGFDPDDVSMMEIGLSRSYSSDEQRAAFFRELTDRVRAIPGVESVSSIVDPPIGYVMWAPPVVLEGPQEGEPPWIPAHMVGPDYFRTMGIRLLRGRGLTSGDDSGHPLVAVVNETMARELWPQGDALGRRIRLSPDPNAPWITVVGVANDIRQPSAASHRRGEASSTFPTLSMLGSPGTTSSCGRRLMLRRWRASCDKPSGIWIRLYRSMA